jgi:hypothetical protein
MPVMAPRTVRPPSWLVAGLNGTGRAYVRETFATFEGWTASTLRLLRLAGLALDDGAAARARIAADGGPLQVSPRGRQHAHPLVVVERRAAAQFAARVRQLRLDQEDR